MAAYDMAENLGFGIKLGKEKEVDEIKERYNVPDWAKNDLYNDNDPEIIYDDDPNIITIKDIKPSHHKSEGYALSTQTALPTPIPNGYNNNMNNPTNNNPFYNSNNYRHNHTALNINQYPPQSTKSKINKNKKKSKIIELTGIFKKKKKQNNDDDEDDDDDYDDDYDDDDRQNRKSTKHKNSNKKSQNKNRKRPENEDEYDLEETCCTGMVSQRCKFLWGTIIFGSLCMLVAWVMLTAGNVGHGLIIMLIGVGTLGCALFYWVKCLGGKCGNCT